VPEQARRLATIGGTIMAFWRLFLTQLSFWALIPCAHASDRNWDQASSIGAGLLVGTALLVPASRDDWEGAAEAGGSIGAAALVSLEIKKIFPETRPDGSDRKGFPSTHSSIAFASAATLQNRYGWQVGIPAQIVAAFVGVSRVKAHKHHWHDVGVGALIGELSGFLITEKESDRVRIMPWGESKGGGFALSAKF
jgi:membrane-associated phospholipid phosphatase